MGVSIKPIGDLGVSGNSLNDARELLRLIRNVFSDLEDQLNERSQIYTSTDGKIPAGLKRDDILVMSYKGSISLLVKNAQGFDKLTAEMLGGLMSKGTRFLGYMEGTVNPSPSDFPNHGDWGFYKKTTATIGRWLCFNENGTIFKTALT